MKPPTMKPLNLDTPDAYALLKFLAAQLDIDSNHPHLVSILAKLKKAIQKNKN